MRKTSLLALPALMLAASLAPAHAAGPAEQMTVFSPVFGMPKETAAYKSMLGGLQSLGVRVVRVDAKGDLLTVSGTADALKRVEGYVAYQNAAWSKQITMDVHLVTVSTADAADWEALKARPHDAPASVADLTRYGKVSTRTHASVTTLNGSPAPFQVSNTRGYVKSASITDGTPGQPAVNAVQPGTLTTGFSMTLTPVADDVGRVTTDVVMNLSALAGADNGFDTFTNRGMSIQLPNVDSLDVKQMISVPAGATGVLQVDDERNRTATFVYLRPTVVQTDMRDIGRLMRMQGVVTFSPAPSLRADRS